MMSRKKDQGLVTERDLRVLQESLRMFGTKPLNDMVDLLNKRRNVKSSLIYGRSKEFNIRTIYNIFNGIVKNQGVRVEFMKIGKDLLEKIREDISCL